MMTPERLEWLRGNADHYHNEGEILELVAHIDALEAKLAGMVALASKHEAALAHAQVIVADAEARRAAAETKLIAAESDRDGSAALVEAWIQKWRKSLGGS